jgi:branched-chain amino acid transport system permease protein
MQYFLQQLINGLSVGSIYALIAVGYTMVYGVLQLINFAHGDVFMVGSLVSLFAATGRLPAWMPWWVHVGVVVALAAVAGLMLARRHSVREVAWALLPYAGVYVALVPTLFVTAAVSKRLPESSWATAAFALVVAVTACGLLGFLIERFAYRPLRDKPRINSLITAIGISLLLEFGGQHRAVFGPTPQPYPVQMVPGIRQPLLTLGDAAAGSALVISRVDALIVAVTLALMLALSYVVLKTKSGLALRAVSFRFDTAALMGVNIDRTISFTFVLGSVLAAVAGVLYSVKYPSVQPLMGLLPGIKAFIAAVFGGIGNIAGAVAGAVIIGLVEVMVVGYVENGSQYRDAIAFVLLIAILLIKPSGLFGKHVVEKV